MLYMKFILSNCNIFISITLVKCSIDGFSYMDTNDRRPAPSMYQRGDDTCNPLYWYPRKIPEYCDYRNFPTPVKSAPGLPIPMPVSVPEQNFIMPVPTLSAPFPGLVTMPYGLPFASSNTMLPVVPSAPTYPHFYNMPYGNQPQQTGMVPGLPGLVSKDGGINILPFSDAYADLIENHKNQMIRRRLEKLIQDYEDFPNGRSYRRLRKYTHRNM